MLVDKLKKTFIYKWYKKWLHFHYQQRLRGRFVFENRRKDSLVGFFILAGYKQYVWSIVFERVRQFVPQDIDICIVSSGVYNKELSDIAQRNGWSYVSTRKNKLTLAMNIAIHQFPQAEYIYKMDEDIFITKNFYPDMLKKLRQFEDDKLQYRPCMVAPLLLINGFGYSYLLKKMNLEEEYTKRFGKPLVLAGSDQAIEINPEVAKFMWGEGGFMPHIDDIDDRLSHNEDEIHPCPIRFSIGAILFPRKTWEDMGYFESKGSSILRRTTIRSTSFFISSGSFHVPKPGSRSSPMMKPGLPVMS